MILTQTAFLLLFYIVKILCNLHFMYHKMFYIPTFFVVLAIKYFNFLSSGLLYLLNSIRIKLLEAKTLAAHNSFYHEMQNYDNCNSICNLLSLSYNFIICFVNEWHNHTLCRQVFSSVFYATKIRKGIGHCTAFKILSMKKL